MISYYDIWFDVTEFSTSTHYDIECLCLYNPMRSWPLPSGKDGGQKCTMVHFHHLSRFLATYDGP